DRHALHAVALGVALVAPAAARGADRLRRVAWLAGFAQVDRALVAVVGRVVIVLDVGVFAFDATLLATIAFGLRSSGRRNAREPRMAAETFTFALGLVARQTRVLGA